MRLILLITLFVTTALWSVDADDLVVAEIGANTILAHRQVASYYRIPFFKRVKNYFYSDLNNRPIRAIQAIDNLHSKASITITAGGLGASFVNLRMKSERGCGLSYHINIYVQPEL